MWPYDQSRTGFIRMKGGIQVEEGENFSCPAQLGSPWRVPRTKPICPEDVCSITAERPVAKLQPRSSAMLRSYYEGGRVI